jgi:hypothetical protein
LFSISDILVVKGNLRPDAIPACGLLGIVADPSPQAAGAIEIVVKKGKSERLRRFKI